MHLFKESNDSQWISEIKNILETADAQKTFDQVVANNKIENYHSLFITLNTLPDAIKKDINQAWMFYILSGEKEAFYYANADVHLGTKTKFQGLTPLHLTILSGNPKHINHMLLLGASATERSYNKQTVLHYAALTGKIDMLDKIIDLMQANDLSLHEIATDKCNALDYVKLNCNDKVAGRLVEKGLKETDHKPVFQTESHSNLRLS